MRNYFIDEHSAYAVMNKIDYYLTKTGWPTNLQQLTLEPYGDGTYSIHYLKNNGDYEVVPDKILKIAVTY